MGPARDGQGRKGRKKGRYGMCLSSVSRPPNNGRRREGKKKRSQLLAAGMLAPVRKQAWQAWGSGGGRQSRPQSEAQPPAGLHGGRKEEGRERGSRREVRVRKIVSLPSWAAGKQDWFLARDRGRSMKVWARLVPRPRPRPRTAVYLPAANRL